MENKSTEFNPDIMQRLALIYGLEDCSLFYKDFDTALPMSAKADAIINSTEAKK
jgi:hypothetical protein